MFSVYHDQKDGSKKELFTKKDGKEQTAAVNECKKKQSNMLIWKMFSVYHDQKDGSEFSDVTFASKKLKRLILKIMVKM